MVGMSPAGAQKCILEQLRVVAVHHTKVETSVAQKRRLRGSEEARDQFGQDLRRVDGRIPRWITGPGRGERIGRCEDGIGPLETSIGVAQANSSRNILRRIEEPYLIQPIAVPIASHWQPIVADDRILGRRNDGGCRGVSILQENRVPLLPENTRRIHSVSIPIAHDRQQRSGRRTIHEEVEVPRGGTAGLRGS